MSWFKKAHYVESHSTTTSVDQYNENPNYRRYVNNKGNQVDPSWQPKFDEIRTTRQKKAEQIEQLCHQLGHVLSGWSPMNNTRCRNRGRMAYLSNVHSNVSAMADIDTNATRSDTDYRNGAATYERCDVNFNNPDHKWEEFKYSDDVGHTIM